MSSVQSFRQVYLQRKHASDDAPSPMSQVAASPFSPSPMAPARSNFDQRDTAPSTSHSPGQSPLRRELQRMLFDAVSPKTQSPLHMRSVTLPSQTQSSYRVPSSDASRSIEGDKGKHVTLVRNSVVTSSRQKFPSVDELMMLATKNDQIFVAEMNLLRQNNDFLTTELLVSKRHCSNMETSLLRIEQESDNRISQLLGDKDSFEKQWKFVEHQLSKATEENAAMSKRVSQLQHAHERDMVSNRALEATVAKARSDMQMALEAAEAAENDNDELVRKIEVITTEQETLLARARHSYEAVFLQARATRRKIAERLFQSIEQCFDQQDAEVSSSDFLELERLCHFFGSFENPVIDNSQLLVDEPPCGFIFEDYHGFLSILESLCATHARVMRKTNFIPIDAVQETPEKNKKIIQNQNRIITELQHEISVLTDENMNYSLQIRGLEEDLAMKMEELNTQQNALKTLNEDGVKENQEMKEKIVTLESAVTDYEEKIKILRREIKEYQRQAKRHQLEIEESLKSSTHASSDKENIARELKNIQGLLAQTETMKRDAFKAAKKAEQELLVMSKRACDLEESSSKLINERDAALKTSCTQRERIIASYEQQIEEIRNDFEKKIEELESLLLEKDQDLASASGYQSSLLDQIADLSNQISGQKTKTIEALATANRDFEETMRWRAEENEKIIFDLRQERDILNESVSNLVSELQLSKLESDTYNREISAMKELSEAWRQEMQLLNSDWDVERKSLLTDLKALFDQVKEHDDIVKRKDETIQSRNDDVNQLRSQIELMENHLDREKMERKVLEEEIDDMEKERTAMECSLADIHQQLKQKSARVDYLEAQTSYDRVSRPMADGVNEGTRLAAGPSSSTQPFEKENGTSASASRKAFAQEVIRQKLKEREMSGVSVIPPASISAVSSSVAQVLSPSDRLSAKAERREAILRLRERISNKS